MNTNKDNSLSEIINEQYCEDVVEQLSDVNLYDEYIKSNSTHNLMNKTQTLIDDLLLNFYTMNNEDFEIHKNNTINNLAKMMITSGTKGVIRGNTFNKLVKEKLLQLRYKYPDINIKIEKEHETNKKIERPDFIITHKVNKKCIIGMNQVDIWNGGQQTNRASKYLDDNLNTVNEKLLCVIANKYEYKTTNSKIYKIMKYGFDNDRICYINNIETVMLKFFDMNNKKPNIYYYFNK